jgi:hypothetical protein
MARAAIRIAVGAPLVALALIAFLVALVIEWLGDLARP